MPLQVRCGWAMTAVVWVIAASACTTSTSRIDHRMLLPEAGARHAVESTQFFVMPMVLAAPEPAFPASNEAAGTVDVTVCAEVWLSEDGDISRVVPFDATVECAQTSTERALAYAQAVVEAMRGWEFTPAMICEFPPELVSRRDTGDCTGPEVTVRRVPVRLDYAFNFSTREGKRRVGVVRQAAGASAR